VSEKQPLPPDLIADIERLSSQLMLADHYAILGVSESASADDVKASYLRLTKRFHPDRWFARDMGPYRKRMEAIFSRATEAYEVLRDPARKLEYDRSLSAVRGIPRASAAPAEPRAPTPAALAAASRLMDRLRPGSQSAMPAVRTTPSPAPSPAPSPPPTPPPPPRSPTATPAPTAPPATGRPRILVVEDDDTLRRMLVRILSEVGDVEEAADGVDALAIVARGPAPRLVVTDVMMPRMDGIELARRLKARPETARVPLVMLTAKSGAKDLVDGVNAGARFYLTKPFKVDDLKAKVRKALGL
jgi:CheY-like chemotaxis protein